MFLEQGSQGWLIGVEFVATEVVYPAEGGIRSREDGRMGRQRYRGQEYKRVQNERRLRQAHRCLEYEFVCSHSNPGGPREGCRS